MTALLMKRGVWIGIAFLVLVLILATFASLIAGQRLQNALLSRTLEEVTGRRVVLNTQPVITIFPALRAELQDVSFHNWGYASDNFPVLKAQSIQLSFSVFAALNGEVRLTAIELDRPVFHALAEDGTRQWPFSHEAKLAKQFTGLIATLPEPPGENMLADILGNAPGPIIIHDGTIILDRSSTDVINKIDGRLVWMKGRRSGLLNAQGVWRGEPTKIEMNTNDLVMLIAGRDAEMHMAVSSRLLNASFAGVARLLPEPYFEGAVFAQANSLLAATAWQGLATPFDFAALGLTISGAFKGDSDKWQLEDSKLQLGTNKGTGGLIFQPNEALPILSGTLDFENLDLAMLTRIFEFNPKSPHFNPPNFSTDLRISANAASFGALELNKIAASFQVSKQANTLDIHNAAAFGGTLQMALKNDANAGTELRVLAENIETKALGKLNPMFQDLPQTRGSVSAILRGGNIADPNFFETAQGTIKLRLGAGEIARYNANQLVREVRKGGLIALKAAPPSILSFTEIDAQATVVNGTIQFDPLRVGLNKATLTLVGAYAVKDQSIALTGTIDLEEGHEEAINGAERLEVFFGGNRNAPLMSSLNKQTIKN